MHMKDNLVNFLYDKKYFITMYEQYVHVFNYKELISLNSDLIVLKMEDFILNVKGRNLFVRQMMAHEILIKGEVESVMRSYE